MDGGGRSELDYGSEGGAPEVPPKGPEQPSTTPGRSARSLLKVEGRCMVGA